MSDSSSILGEGGPFRRLISGFRPRLPQQEMAAAVERALAGNETLAVEAGTGTGKTLAYLVPALRSEGPVIISTGTRSLQDQLFFRDLPMVMEALGTRRRVALLKGRANYLCPYRLELHQEEARFLTRETAEQLQVVAHWAGRTETGDLAELRELPEDAPVWPWVTSTADNCLGQECPHWSRCPLINARQQAMEADLVVVNHHLFLADAALKGEGVADILPGANAVILDEAHHLPETAATFFGESLSGRQLRELGRDLLTEAGHTTADLRALNALCSELDRGAADLRLALGEEGRRAPWHEVAERDSVQRAVQALRETLTRLHDALEPLESASRGMEACLRRTDEHLATLQRLTADADDNTVQWFENFSKSFVLHATPLSVAEPFSGYRERYPCAWIFTSATLSVAGDFRHFLERLGMEDKAETLRLESPFDFRRQAVFHVPEGLPAPGAREYTARLVEAMVPVIEAAGGRTFFLFTSHRALREAASLLRERLDFPLLVQGETGRRQLLEQFRESGNAVLLGAASFWQGIDVRGDALRCVIIDRLPFASPADPVSAARIERLRRQGREPFREYQLPQAVLALRQGAGRLIRDPEDRGLLVVGDPRLVERGYGRLFLDSLPGMTRTRKLEVVQRFFRTLDEGEIHETAGH